MIVTMICLAFGGQAAAESKMYWIHGGGSEVPNGTIQRANLDGTEVENFITGLDAPTGITVEVADGKVYWANSGRIQRANVDAAMWKR